MGKEMRRKFLRVLNPLQVVPLPRISATPFEPPPPPFCCLQPLTFLVLHFQLTFSLLPVEIGKRHASEVAQVLIPVSYTYICIPEMGKGQSGFRFA